jgi:hypothetical protein
VAAKPKIPVLVLQGDGDYQVTDPGRRGVDREAARALTTMTGDGR